MKKQLEIFSNYLSVERGYSTNTLEAYKNDILDLLKFLEKIQIKNLKNVSQENIYGYIEILNSKKYKNSTKSRKIASNKSFFKFLRAENYIQSNPFSEFSQPKVSNKIPDIISIEEIDSIIELSKINNNKFQGYRDSTMIELMYATGMRVSELVNLNLSNIYSSDSIITTIGKGDKQRNIPVYRKVITNIELYISTYRKKYAKFETDALFITRLGKRMSRQAFWLIIKNIATSAGISKKISPHMIRHSFATHLLQGGASLKNVQDLLGHTNIATTQIYTQLSNEYVKNSYNKYHPRK
ncbi:MAG: tyrosine recombinase [Dehalococcoidia bacterium]|nr:tyrosine recombinase [Dehalococcoidia bacterium]MQG09512.1 tyrosine recombinase [SAR202 cluster bacterium]|tara:strand:- start:11811 stop:12701 length:891 start_codon:yes stop_codon:yes gene_type:complete